MCVPPCWKAALALMVLVSVSESQQPTPELVRTKLREQLTSLASVRCEYRVRPPGRSDADVATWDRYVWAQDRGRILHRMLPSPVAGRSNEYREIFESWDGKSGYQVLFDEYSTGSPYIVYRYRTPPQHIASKLLPALYLGLYIRGSSQNVLGLLGNEFSIPSAKVKIEGHDCIMVDLGPYDFMGTSLNHLRLFVDPEVDYLPRQIESFPARIISGDVDLRSGKFEPAYGEEIWQISVREFIEVDDPVLKRKCWFPQKLANTGELTAVVDQVQFDYPMSGKDFVPDMPNGTLVVDDPSGPSERKTIVGGEAGKRIHEAREDERRTFPEQSTTSSGSPVVAVPSRYRIVEIIGVFSVLAFVVVVLQQWLRRQSH